MEAAIIGALLKSTLPKVLSVLGGSRDVRSIQSELKYIEAAIQDYRKKSGKEISHLRGAWIEDLRLFAYDIEDCVDRFLLQVMSKDSEAGFLRRSARAAKTTVFTRTLFSLKIRKLKTRSEEIHQRLKRYIEEETKTTPDGAASTPTAGAPASPAHVWCGAPAAVGMDEPLKELLELVRGPGRPSERKLKVISIVGFRGLGKTLLAHHVYNHGDVRHLFPLRVWVCAAGKDAQEVLKEMLDQVLQDGATTSTNNAQQVDSAGTHGAAITSNGIVPQVEENGVEEEVVENLNGENTSTDDVHGVSTWREYLRVGWTLLRRLAHMLLLAVSVAHIVRASSVQVHTAGIQDATASTTTNIAPRVDEKKGVRTQRQADKGKAIQEDINEDVELVYDSTLMEQRLGSCLKNKRYLIVLDDMQTEELCNIMSFFPVVSGLDSRVIVTTTIQKIARRCSSDNGRVYKMKTLDDNDSRKLFFEVFSKGKCSDADAMELKASALLKKCDGVPLALVSKARFLKSEEDLTKSKCEDACRKLCAPERCDDTLRRMQGVLVSSYESLCSLVLQQVLLYFCMFPHGHRVRRNPLIRRWLAEGLVQVPPGDAADTTPQDIAVENLETLIDRNIIQSTEVSASGNVKRCQPPGMMLEYIVRKSMSQNFITLLCGESKTAREWDYVRRLSLHGYCAELPKSLSRLRTLAVFPTGDAANYEPTLNFAKYDLLRVLDLEECDGLNDGHLQNICNLVFLKYLSLGGRISEVPKKIAKLQWLETLDLRRTKIEKVPVEVIQLPQLKHLLGKFQLIEGDSGKTNPEYLSKRSTLETLSGFVTGESEGFPQLMSHMKRLRKVKIWCKSTARRRNLNHLKEAIKVFIRDGNEWPHRSLSIDFQELSDPFLDSLQAPGSLASLKLRGNLRIFPQFVTELNRIEELCLSSTNLSRGVLLAGSRLVTLKYLKLIEDNIGPLEIQPEHFPSLGRICIVGVKSLHDITIGALPHLTSLHMICEALDGLAGIEIGRLEGLKEIGLHSRVDQGIKKTWKDAARSHPNRPDVLFIEIP